MEHPIPSEVLPSPESSLFQLLALSLANAALIGLGVCEDPTKPRLHESMDLPMAKQNIDLLEMLDNKTRGNLDPEERNLLQSLLFDLRLKYVEANKRK
jgi:hypothetical protein